MQRHSRTLTPASPVQYYSALYSPSGSHKFAAPRCPALAANTTYFVVIESLDTVATRSLSVTGSGDEDSAAAGWSVADHGRRLERGTWTRVSAGSLMIAVDGDIAPLPSAPVVFSYTVAPSDESSPDGVAVGDPDSDGNTIELNGGAITIRSGGGTFPLDYTALFADAEHLVNWARPTLVSAATSKDGKRVRLTFSEDLGRSGRPPTSLFTLKVDGAEAALTGIGIDAAVVDSETWTVDAPLEAPQSWAFTPSGLSPGDQFRLLFVTSTKRDATSTDIDDYNTFVQTAAAASHADISHGFYAVASTADDDARDNTKTTGTGVPIYWLGGNKLADNNADFYDGTWDDENNVTDESGSAYTDLGAPHNVWTGSDDSGTGYTSPVLGSEVRLSRVLGTSASGGAGLGGLNLPAGLAMVATIPNPIYGGNEDGTSNSAPLYGLSLPFVVSATAVEPPSADETQLVGSVVTLELVTPLTSSAQVVTVSYDDPRLGDDSNVIEDLVGNDARSFTNRPVLNRFAFAPPAVEVPADWPLVPEGLPAGAPFRLLFVTSTERDATSAYIEDYDDFVQNAAGAGHESIREYRDGFLALASTAETDARDNTATTGTGVPIYWLGGAKLADNYDDFYDESWDDEVNARDESGDRRSVSGPADAPWTGSNHNGTEAIVNVDSRGLGGATGTAAIGAPGNVGSGIGPLNGGAESRSEDRPLYALSQVFVVEPLAVPTGSAIIPDGLSDGDQFRLLFLTSTTSDALSSEIDDYNSFAQTAAAAGVAGIQAFAGEFRAVVSTADTDARDNTWTTGEGVPIYWLSGARLAGDYADFYDGSWDDETGATDETGSPRGIAGDADSPWTGSNHDGAEEVSIQGSHGLGGDASTGTVVGQLNAEVSGDGPLDADLKPRSETRPLYGLSPVLVVRDILDAPPAAPTGLMATPGDEQVLLRWTLPASDGGRAITRYEYEQDGSGIWISTGSTAASYLVIGLNNRQSYTFRVRAANSIGSGAASGPSEPVTPAKAPDAPTGLRADPGDRQVELTWTAPASDGGSVITGYEYEQDESGIWNSTQSTDLRHTVTGLVNGQSYRFRVRALNDVGEGAESAASASVTPATQADAPTDLSALAGDGIVDLDWTAPESDGGVPITHYEYQQDFGAWTSTGSADTNQRVPNLTNGQTYTFRVRARNRLPDASAESNVASVTPTAEPMPPHAPSDLVARPGHESARLSWNQTGAIVTDYEYELDGSGDWIATGSTDKSYTVRGLNNRQLYRFKVRGVNDDGNGPASAEAQATPNAQPPDPPTDLKAVAGDGQVTLTWTAPKSDGGTAITHYQYEQNGNWHSTVPRDSTDTTYTVTGLTNQRTYRFRVQAFNESQAGPSTPSKVAEARPTGPTPPDAPTGLSAVAGDGRVELSWTAPESDGGFRITGYEYEQNGSGDWIPTRSTAASRTLRGLENGREYTFRVRAINRLGPGAASDPSQPVTPARAPDAPTMLVAVAGDEQVELSWTAPASDGGSVITGYQYEQGDGNWISTQSTDADHTVTGLVNGRSYTFRVRAINRLGPGAISGRSDRVTPARAPDPPTGLSALAGDGFVELDWTAPESDGGLRIIHYEYEQDGIWASTGSAAASYRVPNLTNDQRYGFRVRAVNGLGASAESNFADATPTETLVAPDPPANLQAEAGHQSVRLSWDQTGAIVTRYEYELDLSDDWIATGGKSKTYTVTGLTNDQSYTFRVRAVNSAGTSPSSTSRSATPEAQPPDKPTDLKARAGDQQVTLTWTAPKFDGGMAITDYEHQQDSGIWMSTGSTATSHTVPGLTNGDTYEFQVRAVNDVEPSLPSALVRATPGTTPGRPGGGGGGGSSSGGGGGGGGGGALQNRSPTFTDGATTNRSVAENTPAGAEIGEPVAATDREDDTLTYTLRGADAESFDIDPATGQLLTKAPLDHEATSAYSVIVAVSDGKSSSGRDSDTRDDSITVTIDVENVDEPGAVALSSHQPQVAVALTATLTDPDGGLDRVTWLWERSADQAAWTGVDGAASNSYTPVGGDLGSYLRATASYEDGHGLGKSAGTVTGDPVLVNTVPRFPSLAITIEVEEGSGDAESGGAGAPVAAADPDGDTLTYSLSGADAAVFDIDASTGQLWSNAPLDYEAQANYTVVVSVRDSRDFNGDPDTAVDASVAVTIAVVNVSEPGALILLSSEPRVGVPFAARLTDPDGIVGEVVWQWERSRDGNPWSNSWRTISGAESAAYAPVEADLGYYLRVTASYADGHGPDKIRQAISGAAVMENTGPVFSDAPNGVFEASVAENTGEGEAVGDPVAATSPDSGALTYVLGGADAALFAIDEQTGQIRVGAGTALDYEADRNVYEATVTAADSSGLSATVAVIISVTDVDLGPYDVDKNEVIDRDEAIAAVADYFANRITRDEAVAVVQLYFAG